LLVLFCRGACAPASGLFAQATGNPLASGYRSPAAMETFGATIPVRRKKAQIGHPRQPNRNPTRASANSTQNYLQEGVASVKTGIWVRPDFEEVKLGCEINCYAPAEV
jgi:coenzyme PQQ precursor peptide PqqA